ncbi:hypothetical protein NF867_15525 [Solitalea sp. MAHUQ-68]|uniref:DUF1735 domain-containing protein n=1 Tax=Solitalea agri TaxID=2953739 RepID=A0A9X2F8G9_9SPHI|nr:hypothetical protein [Solitalea agri]MCO4294271.1 hypothetical protein [Solitalea agri]
MKKNLNRLYLFLIAVSSIALVSCEKDADQWLQDNVTVIGKYANIAKFSAPSATAAAGSKIKLDLRYWSEDPIDKINLKDSIGTAAKKQVFTTAYSPAYSAITKTDSLIIEYTVPAGLAPKTVILLEAEVVNKNTLKNTSTFKVTVQ